MNQSIDSEIRVKLLDHDINIPEQCRKRIEETLHGLPEKGNTKWYMQFRFAAAITVAFILMTSITVYAAIDYVRQRMESLSEEEKDSYYEGIQSSPANADSYSREFTDKENESIKELRAKYESGIFPAQKLPVVKTQSEADGSQEFYFVEDTSLFVLPSRELTEEEILEMIDFYYSRDYSLREKVKEEDIVTVSPKEFIEKGGMDEQKAIEMAKADIENVYGIDCEELELSIAYDNSGVRGNIYAVTVTDNETMSDYTVFLDADAETATEIFISKQSSYVGEGIKVDQAKFTARYEDALELLTRWKGTDLPIARATCEYNYNSEDCLEYGLVNYLFEMEDGTGYVLYYSCVNNMFFQMYRIDFAEYRQRIDQNKGKKQEKGIERKIIELQ